MIYGFVLYYVGNVGFRILEKLYEIDNSSDGDSEFFDEELFGEEDFVSGFEEFGDFDDDLKFGFKNNIRKIKVSFWLVLRYLLDKLWRWNDLIGK